MRGDFFRQRMRDTTWTPNFTALGAIIPCVCLLRSSPRGPSAIRGPHWRWRIFWRSSGTYRRVPRPWLAWSDLSGEFRVAGSTILSLARALTVFPCFVNTHYSSATAFVRFCFRADGTSGADDGGCGKTFFLQMMMTDDSGSIRCDVFRQYLDDGENTLADGTSVVAQMDEWEMKNLDTELLSNAIQGWVIVKHYISPVTNLMCHSLPRTRAAKWTDGAQHIFEFHLGGTAA